MAKAGKGKVTLTKTVLPLHKSSPFYTTQHLLRIYFSSGALLATQNQGLRFGCLRPIKPIFSLDFR
jgi:hypothetical protein